MGSCSFYSFNGKDEVRVGGNGSNGSASISSFRGAENFDLAAHIQLKSDFVPANDNLTGADSQGKGASSVVA